MAKFNVNYFETYSGNYVVDAENELDAEQKVKEMIAEGKLKEPDECEDTWSSIEMLQQSYKVKVVETYVRDIEVLAVDEDSALKQVSDMIEQGVYNNDKYDYKQELYIRK